MDGFDFKLSLYDCFDLFWLYMQQQAICIEMACCESALYK